MEIGRNSVVIRNVNFESSEFKKFQSRFSIYDTVTHKISMKAFSTIGNDIFIPASIGIKTIRSIFHGEEETYLYNTTPKGATITYNVKNPPRDEVQAKSLDFILKMKKDRTNRERLVSLKPGSGKTYVTINAISQLGKKPMIIVDTIALAEQWKEQFLFHTDLNEEDIGIISGQDTIKKEFSRNRSKVLIALHKTINSLLEKDPNALNHFNKKVGIGIRVFDECHTNFRNICQINALSNVEYSIYLSATPARSNYQDNTLYDKVFQNVRQYNGKDLEGDPYHTVILSKFDSYPNIEEKLSVKTRYGFSASRWAEYILDSGYEKFYEHVSMLIKKLGLIERKKKTFIILPTLALIQQLKTDLEKEYKIDVGTFIGELKKEKRWDEAKKMLVLTNDKIFDKAIDIPDLEVLINCVPFASAVKNEQVMGRLRYKEGKSSILIDITDFGFTECIRQMKTRKRFYKKKAKKILELE